jgi:hypothetical protein
MTSGLQSIDISDRRNPRLAGEYFAIGSQSVAGLVISGDYAYLATSMGLEVVDISNPAELKRVGAWTNDVEYAWVSSVVLSGSYAYLPASGWLMHVIDVCDPTNPQRVGAYTIQGMGEAMVVWDPYACVATLSSLQMLDVSEPAHPQLLNACSTPGGWASRVTVAGEHAYLSCGAAGLQVFDIFEPRTPQRWDRYVTNKNVTDVAVSGHNAFLLDAEGGFMVFNISEPTSPIWAGSCSNAYGEVLAVAGDYAYVVSSSEGLIAVNISNPSNPRRVSQYVAGTSAGRDISISGPYAYLARYSSLDVIDISDPTNLQLAGSCPCRAAVGVAVSGQHVFVADYYLGLDVIDVSDPANPRRVGGVPTRCGNDVAVEGNRAYLASDYGGLQVFDISDPANPQRVSGNSKYAHVYGVQVHDGKVFLAAGADGLIILGTRLFVLSIFREGDHVRLSWEDLGPGPRLQHATRLLNADWQDLPGYEGTNNAILPIGSGSEFFRLVRP